VKAPVFIGDELSSAGFRLAGVHVRTPAADDLAPTLAWAKREASLIMISENYAAILPAAQLRDYLTQETPLFIVVPEIRHPVQTSRLSAAIRSQLGVLA